MKTSFELKNDIANQKSTYESIKKTCINIINMMYYRNWQCIELEFHDIPEYLRPDSLFGNEYMSYSKYQELLANSTYKEFREIFEEDKDLALKTIAKVFEDHGYNFSYKIEKDFIQTGFFWKKRYEWNKYLFVVSI